MCIWFADFGAGVVGLWLFSFNLLLGLFCCWMACYLVCLFLIVLLPALGRLCWFVRRFGSCFLLWFWVGIWFEFGLCLFGFGFL